MKKIISVILALSLAVLSGCSEKNEPAAPLPEQEAYVSFSDAPEVEGFEGEQLRIIDMLEGNALALEQGESQMYMASISAESPQYADTQQYVVELCEKYLMDIELNIHEVNIDGSRAVVKLTQTASYTGKEDGVTETSVSELEHEMISYQGIWNILSTECLSVYRKHDPDDILRPILACAEAMKNADIEGYMANISPASKSYDDTRNELSVIFSTYKVSCSITDWKITDESDSGASVEVTQKLKLKGKKKKYGNISSSERMLYTLTVNKDGVWLIDSTVIASPIKP